MKNNPSLKIFSMVFAIFYPICFYIDFALFRYYPETGKFYWKMHAADGPAILWYGWIVTTILVSLAAALLVPRKLADSVSSNVVWLVPVVMTVIILIYEKQWFF
jgi:hypothetical protein